MWSCEAQEDELLATWLRLFQILALLASGGAAMQPSPGPSIDAASCARNAQIAGKYSAAADCEKIVLSRLRRGAADPLDRYELYVNYLGMAYDLLMLDKTAQAATFFSDGLKFRPGNDTKTNQIYSNGDLKTSLARLEDVLGSTNGLTEVPLAYVDSGQALRAHDAIAVWLSGRSDDGLRQLHILVIDAPRFGLARLGFAEMLLARGDEKAACDNFLAIAKQREGPSGSIFLGASFVAMQMLNYCSRKEFSAVDH
jgi:hypothetical protein